MKASPIDSKPVKTGADKSNYPSIYIVGLVIGVLLFAVSLAIAHTHQLNGWQTRLFYDLNNLSDTFTKPALWVTEGLGAVYPIAFCIFVPLLYGRYRLAWRFFVAVGGAGILMEAAKLIAKEPRPIVLLNGHVHQRAVELGLTSFPSGHMAVATAMALTVWLILPRAWRLLSILWIVLVGLSRIYLGVHLPIDVVGGFAIGLTVICLIRLLPLRVAKRLHLDNETALLDRGW